MDYEVLSPWADVDPVTLRAISPRVTDLEGKTIGLFAYFKPHGPLIMAEVENRLRQRFPTAKFSHYHYPMQVSEIANDDEYRPAFEDWAKQVDTVVTGHGD
jgi:hypothetical protein